MKAEILTFFTAAFLAGSLSAAPGDVTIAKWADDADGAFTLMFDDGWPSHLQMAIPELTKRNLPADFYIIPQKGEFKVFEKWWQEIFQNPLVHIGNHTMTHNGVKDFEHAKKEFGDCTQYILDHVPGKKPRLISYAQPGVGPGKWNISGEEQQQICREQNLVLRPDFRGHGAVYHHKTKDEMLRLADKAAKEGIDECIIFHGVEVPDPKRGYQDFWAMSTKEYLPFFDEIAARRDRGELWVADHASVHKYKTERESAQIKKVSSAAGKFFYEIKCDADPVLYDQPLTLKVEVPASWKAVKYRQGKDSEVVTVPVKNGFALVKAVPNADLIGVIQSEALP